MSEKNCIDVIRPLASALQCESIDYYQVIGGVNSAALNHKDSIIDVDAKEVIIPSGSDFFLSTRRDNGTLRDIDLLVLSGYERDVSDVNDIVSKVVGNDLEPSVFGFRPEEVLRAQLCRPFGTAACKTILSDRYCLRRGMVKALFPFGLPLDTDSIETWTLVVDDDTRIPIPNPAMSIVNYTNRSISGVRPKDMEKVEQLVDNVFTKAPELRDWAVDGPASSQVALGGLLRSLTPNKQHPNYFGLSSKIMSLPELAQHDSFMLPNIEPAKKEKLVAIASRKARLLSLAESNSYVVDIFQNNFERLVGSIVKNS